jgi:hypothetical protein
MYLVKFGASWVTGALLLGCALLPHQSLFHYFFPMEIFGKNFWLILPLSISLLATTCLVLRDGTSVSHRILLLIALLWVSGVWVGLGWLYISTTEVFINTRPLLIIPTTLLAAGIISKDSELRRLLLIMLITQGVFQAVFGLLHIYVFPQVVTGTFAHYRGMAFFVSDEWWKFTSREAGTLGNPSAYAEMICLGAFASCFFFTGDKSTVLTREKFFLCLGLWLLFLLAILPSLSRVGAVFVSLPFCIFFFEQLLRAHWVSRRWLLGGIVVLIIGLGLLVAINFPNLLHRFQREGMYPRTQINYMLLSTLTENLKYFMHGLPLELFKSLRTPEGFGFGDNSYLRLAASTGVPIFILWVALNVYILRIDRLQWWSFLSRDWLRAALLVYILVVLFLGDVLFNDGWILMSALLINLTIGKPAELLNISGVLHSGNKNQSKGIRR